MLDWRDGLPQIAEEVAALGHRDTCPLRSSLLALLLRHMGLPHHRRVTRCIFCDNKPDSGEHGWSAWAIKRFITERHVISGHVDGKEHFDPHQKAIKVRCVCSNRCNSGWMRELEDAVIPLVGRMGEGATLHLDIPQQWTIARWAVAKAMVWEYVSRRGTIFYTDEDRFMLRDGTIPPSTVVWLSGHLGTETFNAKTANAGSVPGSHLPLQAHITTFAYERLVIQILSVRPYEYADPYSLIDCNQRIWADALVRIWPTVALARWPPSVIMDDEMLDSFHNRCGEKQQEM